MRSIATTLFTLILVGNIACSGSSISTNPSQTLDQWQPDTRIPGMLRRNLVGDPRQPGPYKYQLKLPAGSRIAVHRHSVDVHVKVLSGSMFIIIGEPLDRTRVQHFKAGSVFVVPANAWHDEWWDEESVLEAEGVGPMETTYRNDAAQETPAKLISRIDHLVYATTDLDRGVEEIDKLLGVRASVGGQHPGRGTRNALIALGPTTYLEIIGPDPEQPPPNKPRPFGMDGLKKSRLVAWFVSERDLDRVRDEAVRNGVPLGQVMSGTRRRPDGVQLSWRFTDPSITVAEGIVPLLINWGESPHPALTAAKGATLVSLRAEHPDVKSVRGLLQKLGVDLPVQQGASPALIAVIEGARGRIELR
jgi:mannose-6-phosphate isomerase-like protein (cupin superfamily)